VVQRNEMHTAAHALIEYKHNELQLLPWTVSLLDFSLQKSDLSMGMWISIVSSYPDYFQVPEIFIQGTRLSCSDIPLHSHMTAEHSLLEFSPRS
jgi:hypothetical protein